MKFFILTDLEGVAGTDSFTQTRTSDPAMKESSMRRFGRCAGSGRSRLLRPFGLRTGSKPGIWLRSARNGWRNGPSSSISISRRSRSRRTI